MKIISKIVLSGLADSRVIRLDILSPDIAKKALPGQFVVLMVSPQGERIPLTIASADPDNGQISIIFQEVGLTTRLLGKLNSGDKLFALAGPLGHPTVIKNYGKVVLVGGGVGIAEVYPIARAMKEAGNKVISILGARDKNVLILEKELKAISDELYITTDDGSYARKGLTTEVLVELLAKDKYNLVYAVGPIPMMKKIAEITKLAKVKSIVSLNALMVDATGMCGCCRVSVAGENKFSCVDGPEFDASLVDWDELIKRNRIYAGQEKHICNLKLG